MRDGGIEKRLLVVVLKNVCWWCLANTWQVGVYRTPEERSCSSPCLRLLHVLFLPPTRAFSSSQQPALSSSCHHRPIDSSSSCVNPQAKLGLLLLLASTHKQNSAFCCQTNFYHCYSIVTVFAFVCFLSFEIATHGCLQVTAQDF